jgi:6-phosphofructokinase
LGKAAIDVLLEGKSNKMVGVVKNQIVINDINTVVENDNPIDESLYYLNEIISR